MHMSSLDLNLFVVFDAIFSEGNVTRAARALNLTQPAVSHALARLRGVFADPLFTRQGNAMMPTPLARSLIGPVRQALKSLAASVQQARAFDPAQSSRLFHIGLRDVLEARILPGLMARVHALAPQVDIASVRADRRELETELAGGGLDLAVDVLLQLPKEVRRRQLLRDTQVVVARQDHPKIGPGGLDLDTYLGLDHILVSSRPKGLAIEDMALARLDRYRHVALRCQQYYAACRVVSETDLVLTMPEAYAGTANQDLPTRILPLPLDMPSLDVYLYWHENVDADPANIWIRTLLMEILGQQTHS